jgi:4-amino-4-deoxy-L-arabinose transferase-like glycosyltransferase
MKKFKEIFLDTHNLKTSNYLTWMLLVIILIFVSIIRIRLLNIPFERDEGDYAYIGQLMLHGIPPFKIAYTMKFPGTHMIYALILAIFGQSISDVHFGFMVVNLITILLLFLFVKKLIGNLAAIISAIIYSLMSISNTVLGFAGHGTHFVVLFALAGLLLFLKALENKNNIYYLISGLFLGLAPIMKQTGLFFCLFSGLFLILNLYWYKRNELKGRLFKLILFIVGGAIPFIFLLLLLKYWGVFDTFWFWTISYASDYTKQLDLTGAINNLFTNFMTISNGFILIWILSFLGIIVLFLHSKLKNNKTNIFLLLFIIFSVFSISPGFYFRPHYFVTLLPAIAIFCGVFVDYLFSLSNQFVKLWFLKWIGLLLVAGSIIIAIISQSDYLFNSSPNEISRQLYGLNPFPESLKIAKYIDKHSNLEDKIAVLGSEPEICFYAKRQSASGYLCTYSLMEDQPYNMRMQKEMIKEVENSLPKFVVLVHVSTSWLIGPNSKMYIFDWTKKYINYKDFKMVGIIDIASNVTVYKWDSEVSGYKPKSPYFIYVFERIEGK